MNVVPDQRLHPQPRRLDPLLGQEIGYLSS